MAIRYFIQVFGVLIVSAFSVPPAAAQVPGGSYQQSCQNISVQGNQLIANCRTRTGALNPTRLNNFSGCIGDISNGDGSLMCDRAPVPGGSYQQTCRDFFSDGSNLTGTCRTRSGAFRTTTLIAYRACVGDIWNGDGVLMCNRENPPTGSYQQSCRDVVAEQNMLRGICKDRGGNERQTSLNNYRDCVGDIWNGDGRLMCNRAPLPGGSYQQSCRDAVTDGTTLSSVCKDRARREHATSLANYAACKNDITNMGGELHCSFNALPPQGSYTQSCDDIWTNGSVVFARCRKINGVFQNTQLAFTACTRDIANKDGVLSCKGAFNPTTRLDYTQACAAEMGVVPGFNCLAGAELPITLNGVKLNAPGAGTNCDNPIILGIHNESGSQCVPFARLQRLSTGNPDVETVAICRKYRNATATSVSNPIFHDIAIVQHNRKTGNTCFHQSPVNAIDLDGTTVPSPMEASANADKYWLPPNGVAANGCTSCHDADPFIQSPYIKQKADTSRWDPLGLYHPDFLGIFNASGADPKTIKPTKADGSPSECSACHRIGVSSWGGIGNKIKKSMPPGNTITDDLQWYQAHKAAIDQINACISNPSAAGCGSN